MYAFIIACQIDINEGSVQQAEWRLLLKPSAGLKAAEEVPNPAPEVLADLVWAFCGYVEENLKVFAGLRQDIKENIELWRSYILHSNPHEVPLPGRWATDLTLFQKLIVLKIFRDEKLLFAFSNYVRDKHGEQFVEPQRIKLKDVHSDTDNKTPIIFVLSTGADPTGLLMRFAKEMNYAERLHVISLGQGQGENAKRLIANAKKTGDWVLLQNCHLAKSFMPELEVVVDNFAEDDNIHEDFRLWLTSMPVSYFPVAVLQKGVKLTNEPPKGLRANLLRSYNTVVNPDEFEAHTKPTPWKKLLFGLCFFHGIIQERKKFGPLGWNIMYEFNDSDFETSISVLRMFLEEQEHIPWDALRYVCGHINYGGRVTDDWDRRCLMSILHKYFTPSILNEKYKFSPSGVYYAPAEGPFDSYVTFLQSLPQEVDPEIFGMHENANISFQRAESSAILNTILSLQPRDTSGGGDGKTPDEVVAEMAAEMAASLPEQLKFKKPQVEGAEGADGADDNPAEDGEEEVVTDSLSIVLMQEIDCFNRLLAAIALSLNDLQRAIRGEVVMSAELDAMYNSLLNNQVPDLWKKVAYPSLKPLAPWMEDFQKRMAFIHLWNNEGAPASFWMPGMYFPQGFMTASLQVFARKYKLPIDTLRFTFKVLDVYNRDDVSEAPEDGVFIDGLFMDGARWDPDRRVVADSHLGELFSSVPIIHFMPTDAGKRNEKDYECPVYKTSVRAGVLSTTGQSTNFVLPVDLPSNRDPDYWIQKGAAILCALDF
jgi:dynein heavy chain